MFLLCGFGIFPFIIFSVLGLTNNRRIYGFKCGYFGRGFPRNTPYYRDIPQNGNIFRSYYIAFQYGIIKNKTDILGAIILKWLKEGIARIESRNGGRIFKHEDTVIILENKKDEDFKDYREKQLFDMIYQASKDGILENKEFEKWCRGHYSRILGWFDDIFKDQTKELVSEGLIECKLRNRLIGCRYTATKELKEEALKIFGLKKFLLNYTLISKREAIEVKLFENYLIYAQMMGIAKQVSKQFKELYPNMIEQTNYRSYDNIVYVNYYASRCISSANSGRAAAQSYSSGGGGFSSGGGGSGSFGGGGGRWRIPLKEIIKKRLFKKLNYVDLYITNMSV